MLDTSPMEYSKFHPEDLQVSMRRGLEADYDRESMGGTDGLLKKERAWAAYSSSLQHCAESYLWALSN